MAGITLNTIAGYLEQIKWRHRLVEPRIVLTGSQSRVRFYHYTFLIEVELGTHWVNVRAFLQRHVPVAQRGSVLRYLSILNSQCHHVRFFLIEDCVVLQSEVSNVNCSSETFLNALQAVCRYARMAGVEIAVLSASPSVSALFDRAESFVQSSSAGSEADPLMEADLSFDISANRLTD